MNPETITEGNSTYSTAVRLVAVPAASKLRLLPLVGVMWFIVCGGAYGLEPIVSSVGAGWAVALVIITPFVWSLPIALMVAELASLMPEEGGYYVWVREALGEFWGVQEGWWTICYTAVDLAIYPVLFVNYLAYFLPALRLEAGSSSWNVFFARWFIALLLIAVSLSINWRGAAAVGRNAQWNLLFVLAPFVILVLLGWARGASAGVVLSTLKHDLFASRDMTLLTLGLSTVMWNYMGFDNTSTFAGEVTNPRRNYPRALGACLVLTIAAYLLPLLAGIAVTTDPANWSESAGWPVIARLIGGAPLGVALAVAALLSSWSLFNSNLLYVSRLPYALSRDGWLPAKLSKVSTRSGVPVNALLFSCSIAAVFAALPFGKLVIVDVLLYSAALSLEFAALIKLRVSRPAIQRPFRVPGGWPGIILVTLAPLICATIVFVSSLRDGSNTRQGLVVIFVILSGIVLYLARRSKVQSESTLDARKGGIFSK